MSLFVAPNMVYDALIQLLAEQDKREMELLTEAAALYDNSTVPHRDASAAPLDYEYRKSAWTPAALAAVITDKIATGLYGRPVYRSTGNKNLDVYFTQVWDSMQRTMLRVSKLASMAANTVIRIRTSYPDRITLSDMGLGNCVPILDPDNPHGAPIGLIYAYYTRTVADQVKDALGSTAGMSVHHVVELVTRHQRDERGKVVVPGVHLLFVDGERVPLPDNGYNTLGDFLGAVFWRSSDHPTDALGRSDIIPLIQTLNSVNELLTTTHEKVVWSVHSPVITNVAGNLEFRYGPREIWQVTGSDGFVKRLESDSDITSPLDFIRMLIQLIHETSRVPSVAVGDLEHIGSLSSGRAFEIAMTPLLDLVKEKEVCAIEQEKELMAETMAAEAYYGVIPGFVVSSEYGSWYEPDTVKIRTALSGAVVEFSAPQLPRDSAVVASTQTSLVSSKLSSRWQAIKEIHPDWSDEQISQELRMIDEDPSTTSTGNTSTIQGVASEMVELRGGGSEG